jgi:hypothetical protein
MADRQQRERPLGYPHGWAFLGDALKTPRQAFDRAKNVRYWWPACGLTAVVVLLGYLADPYTYSPMPVGVPLVTGLGLLVHLLVTAVARGVCGGYGADVGATASQAALVSGALYIPWSILGVAVGADTVLVAAIAVVSWVVSVVYLTVLFSAAFEVRNGRAFGGVVVGHLALAVVAVILVGCLDSIASGNAGP